MSPHESMILKCYESPAVFQSLMSLSESHESRLVIISTKKLK